MKRAAVIGSGPAGIAAASALLERGWRVDLFDGGREPEPEVEALREEILPQLRAGGVPQRTERQLRWGRSRPSWPVVLRRFWQQLRGEVDTSVIRKRWLGSDFAFDGVERWSPVAGDFLPQSLAVGGLSRVWGAACYPLRDEDYAHWPLAPEALADGYLRAAALLEFDQADDELRDVYPVYGHSSDWSDWNAHGRPAALLRHWRAHADTLQRAGVHFGRSRLAVDRRERGERGCIQCGQCLYGCARGAIWSSDMQLPRLLQNSRCRHFSGAVVWCLQERAGRSWLDLAGGAHLAKKDNGFDAVFLAAGPLGSFRIAAESAGKEHAETDLLDSDVLVVPFLPGTGRSGGATRFGLSEAVLAFDAGVIGERPAHMQLYGFSGPMAGSLADLLLSLPAPLTSLGYRLLDRLVIGVLYLNSDDSRRLRVRLAPPEADVAALQVERAADATDRTQRVLALFRQLRRETGMRAIERQLVALPAGFSCHLAGTLPMQTSPGPLQTDVDGRVQGFDRLYAVDASTFPNLPAQNSTYTIMANAIRIADSAAG